VITRDNYNLPTHGIDATAWNPEEGAYSDLFFPDLSGSLPMVDGIKSSRPP